jgi:hypothetical protein
MLKHKPTITNIAVGFNGAIAAVAAVFAYSLIVMVYTIIRSSSTIYSIMQGKERNTILLANGFSIAYSVAVFSLLMAVFSTMAGAVAAVILKKSLLYFNPRFHSKKAILISCNTALALLMLTYILFYALLKERMTFSYWETFSFWYLFPAVIFFGVCIIGGSKLNEVLDIGNTEVNSPTKI